MHNATIHNGDLLPRNSFFTVKGACVVGVHREEDAVILRLFSTDERVEVSFGTLAKKAYLCTATKKHLQSLLFDGDGFAFNTKKGKIVTVEVCLSFNKGEKEG